jgi:4-diphosphocytidyl-2-C-methyl-D-erythritol kinase
MISFPNCKINLGLYITEKRTDGFHNLETIFYPIPLTDVLEILPHQTPNNNNSTYTTTGLDINIKTEQNICYKAYQLLKKDFPNLPPIQLHLHKIIPTGAGLGGGSANGAFTLSMLNKIFALQLSKNALINYALQLGSDCPFFIYNTPCYATGRGEMLSTININLNNYFIVLVNPGIHVNTGWAFTQIMPEPPANNLQDAITLPVELWKENISNQFELPISKAYPEIKNIVNYLYQQGASYAAMSGSGSTCFGLFKKEADVSLNFSSRYFVYKKEL